MAKLSLHFKPNALIVEENSLIIRHERIEPHRLHENKFKNPKQKKKKNKKQKIGTCYLPLSSDTGVLSAIADI